MKEKYTREETIDAVLSVIDTVMAVTGDNKDVAAEVRIMFYNRDLKISYMDLVNYAKKRYHESGLEVMEDVIESLYRAIDTESEDL